MRKDRYREVRGTQDEGALGIMEGRGQREQEAFSGLPLHARRREGSIPLGSGWPSSPGWPGGAQDQQANWRPGREDGKGPRWGESTRLTCTGLERLGRRGSAQRVSQAPARPHPADARTISCGREEVLTLILETPGTSRGGRRGETTMLY